MKRTVSILCIFMVSTLFLGVAHAQEKSLGTTFSYAGTGLDYVQFTDSRHFAQYQIRVETTSLFLSEQGKAGISASAFWNTVFAQAESRDGNIVRFYAGPGICAGYSEDIPDPSGVFFGLKGSIGAECSFSRGIAISLSVSPMLGGHFKMKEGMLNMRIYKGGLWYGLMPEVGIRYIF